MKAFQRRLGVSFLSITGVLLIVVSFAGASASAHMTGKTGKKVLCHFLPKNKLKIPVNRLQEGGITEAAFNAVITKVSKYYEPIIKSQGGTLKVNRLWKDATVNASAERDGNTWIVNMYGGLARHHIVNEDGFSLVMCHEVGHHLAGYPIIAGDDWASNEGQSDYFATMKCFRRINEKQNNMARLSQAQVPSIVKERCSVQFKSAEEIALCARNSIAGMNLALLLWDLSHNNTTRAFFAHQKWMSQAQSKPDFGTPDKHQVTTTDDEHPAAQCRLDTYFNGSSCGISFKDDFSREDPVPGACAQEKGDSFAVRPRCWYKPKNSFQRTRS